MRCYGGRDATDVAVRRVQLLAVVDCSRSFGGTTGARLGYLCHPGPCRLFRRHKGLGGFRAGPEKH